MVGEKNVFYPKDKSPHVTLRTEKTHWFNLESVDSATKGNKMGQNCRIIPVMKDEYAISNINQNSLKFNWNFTEV